MTAKLSISSPLPPSIDATVKGTGFENVKTRLILDGEGATMSTFHPGMDGSFCVGIQVSAVPATQTLVAEQYNWVAAGVADWREVVRASIVVPS